MISILMPVFNTEKYLSDCLDSILRQTQKNWELLAVNDRSTDGSRLILEQYAARDGRIKVLDNTNKGIIPALRLAYAQSRGELITRMDSDDLMTAHKLQALKQTVLSYDGQVATGKVKYFTEEGEIGAGYRKYEQWLNQLGIHRYAEIYKECVIPSPCWMIRRQDLDRVGAFHSDRYPEDYDLCFRFYHHQIGVQTHEDILHLWRDRPDRISRTGEHYANNSFLDLKLHYYLQHEYDKSKEFYIWGAGKKGKKVAQFLIKKDIPFQWITDNPRKCGVVIYDKQLVSSSLLTTRQPDEIQGIILVANPAEQQDIWYKLKQINIPKDSFIAFC
ncbi:MAG: glycosyltransferase family 2 protein [Bacteroidota bacterium]